MSKIAEPITAASYKRDKIFE